MGGVVLAIFMLILLALALSLPATWVVRRLGTRLGALDAPGSAGHVKSEVRRVPNTGGVAIFFAIAAPLLAGLAMAWLFKADVLSGGPLEPLAGHLPGARARTPMALALLLSLALLHVLGLIDDRRPLGPWLKLGVQIVAAGVLIVGFDTRMLTLLDGSLPPLGYAASVLVTLLWFLVVTNAINFMDNMDALAGGVVAIAASIFLAAAMLNEQWFLALLLALVIGACLGFLLFNRPPATIFMGDGGSLVLGFLLAFLTVRTTYYGEIPVGEQTRQALGAGYTALFMPLIILAVPLYDFVGVVTLRLSQGRNPMTGDEQHFSHRLVRLGMSKRGAVFVIHACTVATGIGGITLARLPGYAAILVFLQTACILGVLAALELATARHKRRSEAA